jgi:hypothetical protein
VRRVILSREAAKDLKLRNLRFLTALGMTLAATAASACPVCFGGPNSLGKGTDAAIWFLLAVIGFVQLGFVALFWSFWRRAKELRRKRESFHLIEGGVR